MVEPGRIFSMSLRFCNKGFGGIWLRGWARGALLPSEIFFIKWARSSSRNIVFIVDLHSCCYRQNLRAFYWRTDLSYISTTQFHLRKLSKWWNSNILKDITFPVFTNWSVFLIRKNPPICFTDFMVAKAATFPKLSVIYFKFTEKCSVTFLQFV